MKAGSRRSPFSRRAQPAGCDRLSDGSEQREQDSLEILFRFRSGAGLGTDAGKPQYSGYLITYSTEAEVAVNTTSDPEKILENCVS